MGRVTTDHIAVPLTSLSLSNDNNCILLSCLDSTLKLLDRSSGEMLNEYTSHKNEQYQIGSCFSNDDAFVASGSEDGILRFWKIEDGKKCTLSLKTSHQIITRVLYHPKETLVVSSGMDGSINVWR